ncbi:Rhodanese-like domain-containing protein 4A, chloroplastic [Ananas comosus]|uniref:Rhodanese-like domain-containing protein 4A, chloroplastic n=1 Tax=Ananas comosus TaxID=4615 RepID=A0A199VHC1_ANACO|nr:Rhodanese-like domain-containing protein 4A, chloroplastic [Ananas comosus]
MALLINHLLLLHPPKPSPISQTLNPHQNHFSTPKTSSPSKSAPTHLPNPSHSPLPRKKLPPFSLPNSLPTHVPIPLQFALILTPFPSPAAAAAAEAEFASEKINIEAVLTSIDDFFNKNPFFVAGVTFIWLVVIPLTQEYLKKYKYISAIDAFRKLRDVPEAQLLDIRKKKSVRFMASPSLRILGKDVVHVEFSEGDEDGFVKEVLKNYGDPQNTVICVLDNFGGDSLKVAELLFKNGFKEAYAIEGGLRGNDGWQAIQEKYLAPSMHVYPRKRKSSTLAQLEMNGNKPDAESNENGQAPASSASANGSSVSTENGYIEPIEAALVAKSAPKRPSSPYPKYHNLKPPSSPTPSKPQS